MNLNLSREENEILEVKYKSKPIGNMTESEISKWGKALLVKIHVITGWVIPASEEPGKESELMNILVDQFQKKMKESYFNVNADEIEFAFRTYGTTVKDWGKNMNLALIDEVMIPYLEARMAVSRLEEQKKAKMIDAPKEKMSEQTYQDWYESTAKDFKEGKIKSFEFLPPTLADWLIAKGEIDHEQYFKRAAIEIGKKLRAESETDKFMIPKYLEFKRQYEQAINKGEPFTGNWALQIENLAKKIALNNYILQEQEL
jgi:hypothetical protein